MEILNESDWYCEECKMNCKAKKCIKFAHEPKNLILVLQRLKLEVKIGKKMKNWEKIMVPIHLDLTQYLANKTETRKQ